jgi:hypothetical protein
LKGLKVSTKELKGREVNAALDIKEEDEAEVMTVSAGIWHALAVCLCILNQPRGNEGRRERLKGYSFSSKEMLLP